MSFELQQLSNCCYTTAQATKFWTDNQLPYHPPASVICSLTNPQEPCYGPAAPKKAYVPPPPIGSCSKLTGTKHVTPTVTSKVNGAYHIIGSTTYTCVDSKAVYATDHSDALKGSRHDVTTFYDSMNAGANPPKKELLTAITDTVAVTDGPDHLPMTTVTQTYNTPTITTV